MKRFPRCISCVISVLAVMVVGTSVFSSFQLSALGIQHDTIDFSAALSSMKPTPKTVDKKYSLIHDSITLLDEERNTTVIPYMYYALQQQTIDNNEQQAVVPSSTSLVVGVLSSISNQIHRITIRDTWGLTMKDRLFFLVSGESLPPELQQEMEHYHDLLFVQQPDSYRWGLTPKSLAFFHAMDTGDIPYQHALKTDDDSYIHVDRLQAWLLTAKPQYAGSCFTRNQVYRFRKNRPNYVSEELYPNVTYYPPYASGAGYVLSRKASKCLSQYMGRFPYLPCEDTNTGRILHEFCEVPCTTDARFNWNFNQRNADVAFLQHYLKNVTKMKQYHDLTAKPELPWTSESVF